jgi:hypothetical protein
MVWFLLSRRTGETGGADFGTTQILLSGETIQFFQPYGAGTRIYLKSGAIETIDVIEKFEEIFSKAQNLRPPDVMK